MRKYLSFLADIASILLAIAIIAFFIGRPGYQPTGEYGMLTGIGVVLVIAIVYLGIQSLMVLGDRTPSPLYTAFETFLSHIPAYALVWVAAASVYGKATLSPFQWVSFGIFVVVILVDVIGFAAVIARQLLLTDEMKSVR